MDADIHQVESLRRKTSYYWPNYGFHGPRPALNVPAFIALLSSDERLVQERGELSESAGGNVRPRGKRKRKEQADPGPAKRVKLSTVPGGYCGVEGTSFLQVYQFGLNLRYNNVVEHGSEHYADDEYATRRGWLKEEEELRSLLTVCQKDPSLSGRDIDLGWFFTTRCQGRILALFESPHNNLHIIPEDLNLRMGEWLFSFPEIPWGDGIAEDDLEEQDMQPSDMHRDFITACTVLQTHGRAKLEASLHLRILSEGAYDPSCDFPFELHAQFTLSLVTPRIYHPFDDALLRGQVNELEGLQRRLLCFLSKTPLTRPVHGLGNTTMEDASNITIPFFLNVMLPASPLPRNVIYELLQPDGLLSTLMPFQRRTVAWMLEREGKRITPSGTIVPLDASEAASSSEAVNGRLPLFWEEIELGGRNYFFNRLTSCLSPTAPESHTALGGILAEEPGLGKTMECLSLMLLNPAPKRNPSSRRWDPDAQVHVKEIKTTLIVTPPTLAAQWVDELAAHAPDLKVFVYEGWAKVGVPITEADVEAEKTKRRPKVAKKSRSKSKANGKKRADDVVMDDVSKPDDDLDASSDPAILDWPNFINQFDVCITTYKVLRTELFVARAPPERSRRQDVDYKNLRKPRSPLVICEWYRVIMDEVQMMGTGKSEEMVSLIPRLSSFAVSGTPARAQVSDLIGVLRFLRIDDLVTPARMWKRLLKCGFKDLFASLFQKYSVRTLKSSVQNELTIPQQQRYLVSIELGRVERHVYDQALEESLAELGLDARGVAAYEGWEVDASVLRNVLRRLRGICTHPQVGQLLRQGDRANKSGGLKSIADVLESMKDQNWRNLSDDRKAKILALTRLAQLQQHRSDEPGRYQRALEFLLSAETEANQLIDDIKACVAQHHVKGEALKIEAQALRDSRKTKLQQDGHPTTEGADKGKGRERERDSMSPPIDLDLDSDEDEDVEDRGLPKTPAGEDHRTRRMALLARLRECLMVLHRVKFLQGDVYHVFGSSHSEKEDAAYADAETLRKDLLKSTEEAANRAMRRLSTVTTERRVTEQTLQIPLPFMEGGGIRSTHLFEEANEIIEDVLNRQSVLLWQWRTKIVELLTQKLNSAGEQADGEEYSRTLDTQGEAEVFLQAYTALLADRREAIAAEKTLLAAHEGREKKTRKTRVAARAKQQDLEVLAAVDMQPQHEVLYGELLGERKELRLSGRALKSVMVDLSSVAANIPKDADPEKVIAKDGAAKLRALIADLQRLNDKLDADLTLLRKVFNDRILYFRQLQEISDTVAEVEWEGTLADSIEATKLDNDNLGTKIITWRARQRYLDNLAMGGSIADDSDAVCVLCQCEFSRGYITQCAHIFCEGCMKAWMSRGQGRACPVCRSPIDPRQLQRFTLQEDHPPPPRPVLNKGGELVPVSYREIQYNIINSDLFADIQTMESNGNYGSKIQTLVRHLLHIQVVDPGAKSIVFSAWADSLTIVEHALYSNGIPCMRLDQSQGKGKDGGAKRFRVDPDLQVLLLHGERDNAGLNVTCASRVFLLESVVNHGFEVQAIARIDRLGQTKATEVFCYYAEDTVEKNILDLAARQGLSLYTKDNAAGSVNITSFAMDSEKNLVDAPTKPGKKTTQKGDFIFKVNDMLAILFPHMFEDIDFLLPPDARAAGTPGPESSVGARPVPVRPSGRRTFINAEAGPSRRVG